MKNSQRRAAIILSFTCALVTTCAHAIPGQPGTLDATWAASSPLGPGKVITPIGSGDDRPTAMTLPPDGKVLVAGKCSNGSYYDFCAARYLPNGTLDNTWSGTGTVIAPISSVAVISPFGGVAAAASTVTLQPDGKALVAGTCTNFTNVYFCAARFLPNGTLDTSWNDTGSVITRISNGFDSANAMTLQPDGKVLLAGQCFNGTNYDFCAARYLANGTLDTSWNGTGTVTKPIGSSSDNATAMTLQSDGKVLLAGYCSNGTNFDFCAARFLPDGTLDTTWNGTGTVITPIGSSADLTVAMTLQPDGKVLVAGFCSNGANNDFCVVRYDGGPFGYQNCKPDLDGDGSFLATTDALINMRIALGITGPAVIGGITFSPNATRNTWPLIRDYLVTQCGMSLVQ